MGNKMTDKAAHIQEAAAAMKRTAPVMAASTGEMRNAALEAVADALSSAKEEIFAANAEDLKAAAEQQLSAALVKRLKFDQGKMDDAIAGIRQLIGLADPIGRELLKREMDEGLVLRRVSCPIGVIGVIFEARPDALVQISSLCIKSGNCAILKGGKETANTNRVLFRTIRKAVTEAGLPENCLYQAEQHDEIDALLACEKDVDLLIPRGSNAFVQYIMEHTKIPVMGHADGVCHIYADSDCDMDEALKIIVDAKTQYTAACNAVETVLVNRKIADVFLPALAGVMQEAGVELRGTQEVSDFFAAGGNAASNPIAQVMAEDDFHTEYLELILSVKLVDDVKEAVDHINRFGSHHTDAIMTKDDSTAAYFLQMVDSAGVYRNCSTRFADGFRYGFGAEVGISTSKLHARGPVGLDGLVTYKYEITGCGQIVGDYASGKKQFHFRDL